MTDLFCPFAERYARYELTSDFCLIYRNYIEQTKDDRTDIIRLHDSKYYCVALEALFGQETGIKKSKELDEKLKSENPVCALIELLNNSSKKS